MRWQDTSRVDDGDWVSCRSRRAPSRPPGVSLLGLIDIQMIFLLASRRREIFPKATGSRSAVLTAVSGDAALDCQGKLTIWVRWETKKRGKNRRNSMEG